MLEALPRERRQLSPREGIAIWLGALGPPAAWVLHFALGYLFTEAACLSDEAVDAVEPLVFVATVVLAALSLAAGLAAYMIFRRVRGGALADPRGRLAFMTVAAMIGAGLFTALIVLEGVQAAPLSACRPG